MVTRRHGIVAAVLAVILLVPVNIINSGAETLFPIKSTAPAIKNEGASLSEVAVNQRVSVSSSLTNTAITQVRYTAIIELRDDNGATEFLQWQKGAIDFGESKEVAVSWTADKTGNYEAKLFILSSLEEPRALSEVMTASFSVGERNLAAPEESPSVADYTFMVYMVASDLESNGYYATADLKEMMAVGSTPAVNVIVETGGAANATIDDQRFIDFTKVQIHKVKQGNVTTLEDLGQQNMGDSRTLTSFITWTVSHFPAKKYVMVLWDHGNGLHGFGKDDIFNDNLTLNEMNEALRVPRATYQKFEIIGFDACLMASVEVANRLAPFGNYLVASEELEPSWGWDYSAILTSLTGAPTQDGVSLGKVIADTYVNHSRLNSALYKNYDADKSVTLSVIDLAKIPDVVKAVDKLGDMLSSSITKDSTYYLAKTVRGTERYGEGGQDSSGHLDLYNLADNLSERFPVLKGTIDGVKTSVQEAIVYSVSGEAKPDAHGISMFLQVQDYESNARYLQYIIGRWISIFERSRDILEADITPPEIDLVKKGETISGEISFIDLAEVSLFVLQESDDKVEVLSFQQQDPSVFVDPEGKVNYKWSTEILSLCEGQSCEHTIAFLEKNGKIQYAYFPVRLESESFSGAVILIYTIQQDGRFEFLGGWPGIDEEGNAIRQLIPLALGDKIYSYTYEIDENGNLQVAEHGPLTVSENFGPAYRSYPGNYFLVISACDFSGNCSYSNEFEYEVQ